MPDINDLGLAEVKLPQQNLADLPEQRGGFDPLPQPGYHVFTLPSEMTSLYEKLETTEGPRLQAVFKGKHALQVDGKTFMSYRMSNKEFFDAQTKKMGSEMGYLLNALGFSTILDTNGQYEACLRQVAGRKFGATIEWTGRSRNTGARFGQNSWTSKKGEVTLAIPKDPNGRFQESFDYEGEQIRCFPRLRRYNAIV